MQTTSQLEIAEKYIKTTNVSVFLTGKAGTGKTTFLRHIVSSACKRSVVLAPTGVAAVNAGGVTIHSFFQLPLCPYLPDVKELVTEYQMPDKYKSLRKEKIKIIRTLDLVIIDEISMVRADLLDAIDMTLRRYRRSSKPFGGVQLLMIGDVQQLPPVVKEEERPYIEQVYPSAFFFHSKALKKTNFITIELTKIFRQQDPTFINLLNSIRDNHLDKNTLAKLNSRYKPRFSPADNEGYIRLTTHNWQANEVNQSKLAAIQSNPIELKAVIEGTFPESSYPTESTLTLKKGAQVMFVKNDSNAHQYYNGKLATVEGFDPEEGVAVVDTDGQHIIVKQERWENVKYEIDEVDNQIKQKVDGTFTQFPLRLAWAITVHKSQGLTFDKVIIDAAMAFTYGQVYVALSRCRTLEGLVLASPISEHCVFDNDDIHQFNSTFLSADKIEGQLSAFQSAYFNEMVYELFDFSAIIKAADRVNDVYQQHLRRTLPTQAQRMSQLCTGQLVDLGSVSEKFHNQLSRISMQGTSGDEAFLNERIAKGVAYFDNQIQQLLQALVPLLEIEVGNKAVAAEFNELSASLTEAVSLKQKCLKRVAAKGFSTEVYNQAKVDFMLEQERDSSGKKATYRSRYKKDKEPKPKKAPVWVETVRLFSEGRSIEDIAKERGLTYKTITTHLQNALEAGAISVDTLLTTDELDDIVEYIIEMHPKSLTEMHEHFDGKYQYYKLRAAAFEAKDLL